MMSELDYWTATLTVCGYWFPKRKAKKFLAERKRISDLWCEHFAKLGDFDRCTMTFRDGRCVEEVERELGLVPPPLVPMHPFEVIRA